MVQRLDNDTLKSGFIFALALPYDDWLPALLSQQASIPSIPILVPVQLSIPVLGVTFWPSSVLASMAMPEAAMDQEHGPILRHHYVRLAGQAGIVQLEPVTHAMQEASHHQLRTGVHRPDARHDPASVFLGHHIRQLPALLASLNKGVSAAKYLSTASRTTHARETFLCSAIREIAS
jgi:hypothetical protein